MNLINVAAEIFLRKVGGAAGSKLDPDEVVNALQALLPTNGGELDLQALLGKFVGRGGNLAALAASWLGNSNNLQLSGAQVLEIFGQEQVSQFASKLGMDTVTAAKGLSDTIPDVIDKSSEDGSLLDNMQLKRSSKLFGGLF